MGFGAEEVNKGVRAAGRERREKQGGEKHRCGGAQSPGGTTDPHGPLRSLEQGPLTRFSMSPSARGPLPADPTLNNLSSSELSPELSDPRKPHPIRIDALPPPPWPLGTGHPAQ